jgi:hypothetical protein
MEQVRPTERPSCGEVISRVRARVTGVIGAGVVAWVMGITIDTGLAGLAVGAYLGWGLTGQSELCMRLVAVFFGAIIVATIGMTAFWASVAPLTGVAVFGGIMGAIDGLLLQIFKGLAKGFSLPPMVGVICAVVICGFMGAVILFYPLWLLRSPSPPPSPNPAATMGIYAFAVISGAMINGAVPWLVESGAFEDGLG